MIISDKNFIKYESPIIEIFEISVEKGFAGSTDTQDSPDVPDMPGGGW